MESTCKVEENKRLRTIKIETSVESLKSSEIFHIVKELIGFVLFMHHQIPAVLQHLENEFGTLKEECKTLDSISVKESTVALQRKNNMRKREVKYGIKRLEKLMNAISSLLSALRMALDETASIQGIILVLGASPARPLHIYELFFDHQMFNSEDMITSTRTKVAEALSRKMIRALVSKGAGSCSYTGPTTLFLLVKSSCTLSLPLHFLPKRDFKYHKKAVPFMLHIKSKNLDEGLHNSQNTANTLDSSNDAIWFQCKHTVKGLASKAPVADG